MKLTHATLAVSLAALLAACGGGGGYPNTPVGITQALQNTATTSVEASQCTDQALATGAYSWVGAQCTRASALLLGTVVTQSQSSALGSRAAGANSAANAAVAGASSVTTIASIDVGAFFDWAEKSYPTIFPGRKSNLDNTVFVYRYYPETLHAIGVSQGKVYGIGPLTGNQLALLGNLTDFTCQVSPTLCVPPAAPTVSTISSAAPLSYSKVAQVTVTGNNLDQGISLTAPGCSTLTEQAGSTASTKTYSCKVAAATALSVKASNSTGDLLTVSLPVPDPQVTMVTSLGTVVLELNPAKAPISVDNFLKYVGDGFYSGLLFHRVISTFMVQGGGFTAGPTAKTPTYPAIKLESNNGLSNLRGTLAMARTNVADSATSQFYINVVDNTFLNYTSTAAPGYAVFGKVVDGLTVVDAIRIVPTGIRNGMADVPVVDVTITSATQTR